MLSYTMNCHAFGIVAHSHCVCALPGCCQPIIEDNVILELGHFCPMPGLLMGSACWGLAISLAETFLHLR